ncbi:MAG: PDZ domain-containing protein [Pseudomonadota bacterium]
MSTIRLALLSLVCCAAATPSLAQEQTVKCRIVQSVVEGKNTEKKYCLNSASEWVEVASKRRNNNQASPTGTAQIEGEEQALLERAQEIGNFAKGYQTQQNNVVTEMATLMREARSIISEYWDVDPSKIQTLRNMPVFFLYGRTLVFPPESTVLELGREFSASDLSKGQPIRILGDLKPGKDKTTAATLAIVDVSQRFARYNELFESLGPLADENAARLEELDEEFQSIRRRYDELTGDDTAGAQESLTKNKQADSHPWFLPEDWLSPAGANDADSSLTSAEKQPDHLCAYGFNVAGTADGVQVTGVVPGGPAYGKLKKGYRITKIDRTDIADMSDFRTAMDAYEIEQCGSDYKLSVHFRKPDDTVPSRLHLLTPAVVPTVGFEDQANSGPAFLAGDRISVSRFASELNQAGSLDIGRLSSVIESYLAIGQTNEAILFTKQTSKRLRKTWLEELKFGDRGTHYGRFIELGEATTKLLPFLNDQEWLDIFEVEKEFSEKYRGTKKLGYLGVMAVAYTYFSSEDVCKDDVNKIGIADKEYVSSLLRRIEEQTVPGRGFDVYKCAP